MTTITFHPTAAEIVPYHSRRYGVVSIDDLSGEAVEVMDMSHTGRDG